MKRVISSFMLLMVTLFLLIMPALADQFLKLSSENCEAELFNYQVIKSENTVFLVLFAKFTCYDSIASDFSSKYSFEAYQNGIQCADCPLAYFQSQGDPNIYLKVKSGASINVYEVKELKDITTDIEVILKPRYSADRTNIVTGVFPLEKNESTQRYSLQLSLTPDVFEKIENNAELSGLSIDEYVSNILTDYINQENW